MSSTLARSEPAPPPSGALGSPPIVAVSATADALAGSAHRMRLNTAYVRALESAGLIPVVVPPLRETGAARTILSTVRGLVLTGGEDVEPSLYGQERSPACKPSNLDRDRTEIALARAARELGKPVLAICRGPQVLNVALGGTLYQDIPSDVADALEHNAESERDVRVHEVEIEPGSRIAQAVGATRITVNSFHHQAIRQVAAGLRVTARAPDGIIEGVESASRDWWVLAVQWHPEEMDNSAEAWDRGIFRAFAELLTRE